MKRHAVSVNVDSETSIFKSYNIQVPSRRQLPRCDIRPTSAVQFERWKKVSGRHKSNQGVEIFAASVVDIEKALAPKYQTDPASRLAPHYHQYMNIFDHNAAETLLAHRGRGIDHDIELIKDKDGNYPKVHFGPLYSQSRKELLVLCKTLNDLLDENCS